MRRLIYAAMLLCLPCAAFGTDLAVQKPKQNTVQISCAQIRDYADKYGAALVEAYARSKGATEEQITAGRRCVEPVKFGW